MEISLLWDTNPHTRYFVSWMTYSISLENILNFFYLRNKCLNTRRSILGGGRWLFSTWTFNEFLTFHFHPLPYLAFSSFKLLWGPTGHTSIFPDCKLLLSLSLPFFISQNPIYFLSFRNILNSFLLIHFLNYSLHYMFLLLLFTGLLREKGAKIVWSATLIHVYILVTF